MSILSDRDIKREILNGNIVLFDPDRKCDCNIQNCSVDITLGEYYYRNKAPIKFLNPWNEKHVNQYWGEFLRASKVETEIHADELGLKVGDMYILLIPGESILGHTREFIGGKNNITTMIKARSSMGRNNVTICRDAGWGDINFISRWTLEITNNGTSPLVLPVGSRIGQIIFMRTGEPDTIYNGKYQPFTDIDTIVRTWNPTLMLPKAYLDK
jgi:dCTP deaminase